jgi:transposase
MMLKCYVGIDVSKATLDICLLRQGRSDSCQVANTRQGMNQLHHWLKKRQAQGAHVCLEATGIYSVEVAQFLHERGYVVSVVNPQRIKGFADSQMRRSKTDKLDAALMAAFCQALQPEAWTPPEPAWYELRALLRQLEDLQQTRQQQVNRLESAASPVVRAQLEAHIVFVEQQIEQLHQMLKAHLQQHPDLKQQVHLLTSIPGIGFLTACRLVGEIRSISSFDDVRQRVAFVGLDPTRHDSGSSVRGSRSISRKGRAALRAALYMPALCARKHNPILRAFAAQLATRGKSPKQIITALMRKLLHLAYGILKSGQPFDPHYLQALDPAA